MVLFQKNSKDFFITIRSRYPLSYTSIWGKKIDMYFNFFLIKNEKKMFIFWMEVLAHFYKGKIQWDHAQIPCQNVKSKEFLFILEHKYAQSHKKNNL
jgi:hypothetical protein